MISLFLLVCIPIFLIAQEPVALTMKVKGSVELTRERQVQELKVGAEILNNDVLKTGNDSFAALRFIDGSSLVRLFPNSLLEIKTEVKNRQLQKKNSLKLGELWSQITGREGTYEVETPTTVVSVKGTSFLVAVDERGFTDLYTFEGQVQMENKLDGRTVLVEAGYHASSSGSGEIEIIEFDPEEMGDEVEDPFGEETGETLEIRLKNAEGEGKSVKIILE